MKKKAFTLLSFFAISVSILAGCGETTYKVEMSPSNEEYGYVTGGGKYSENESATFYIYPNYGCENITGFSKNGESVSLSAYRSSETEPYKVVIDNVKENNGKYVVDFSCSQTNNVNGNLTYSVTYNIFGNNNNRIGWGTVSYNVGSAITKGNGKVPDYFNGKKVKWYLTHSSTGDFSNEYTFGTDSKAKNLYGRLYSDSETLTMVLNNYKNVSLLKTITSNNKTVNVTHSNGGISAISSDQEEAYIRGNYYKKQQDGTYLKLSSTSEASLKNDFSIYDFLTLNKVDSFPSGITIHTPDQGPLHFEYGGVTYYINEDKIVKFTVNNVDYEINYNTLSSSSNTEAEILSKANQSYILAVKSSKADAFEQKVYYTLAGERYDDYLEKEPFVSALKSYIYVWKEADGNGSCSGKVLSNLSTKIDGNKFVIACIDTTHDHDKAKTMINKYDFSNIDLKVELLGKALTDEDIEALNNSQKNAINGIKTNINTYINKIKNDDYLKIDFESDYYKYEFSDDKKIKFKEISGNKLEVIYFDGANTYSSEVPLN